MFATGWPPARSLSMSSCRRTSTVYPEYVPDSIHRGTTPSRLAVLTAALREKQVDIIDLRDSLLRAKSTVCSTIGRTRIGTEMRRSWLTARFCAELSRTFPKVQSHPRSYFKVADIRRTGDLNLMLGLTHGYEEDISFLVPATNVATTEQHGKITITTGADPQLPRMMMLHDSFGNFLVSPLLDIFEEPYTFSITRSIRV